MFMLSKQCTTLCVYAKGTMLPLTAQPRTLTPRPEESWTEQAKPQTDEWPGFAVPWLQMYIQHLYIICLALTSNFSRNTVMKS